MNFSFSYKKRKKIRNRTNKKAAFIQSHFYRFTSRYFKKNRLHATKRLS